MTARQLEICRLLKDLKRPAELIAVNAGLPVEAIKAWLKSGVWPKSSQMQQTLFDATGLSPRPETTKPATVGHSHGLRLFAHVTGGQDRQPTATPAGITE